MEDPDRAALKNICIIIIIASIIVSLWIGYLFTRVSNDRYCGRNQYTFYGGQELTNSSRALNGPDSSLLQELPAVDTASTSYLFCFDYSLANSSIATITITDETSANLATYYINNLSNQACVNLDKDAISTQQYLGVECNTCSPTGAVLLLQKEIAGQTTNQIHNGTIAFEDNDLSFKLLSNRDCRHVMRWLAGWYGVFIAIMLFVLLVIFGLKKLGEVLNI